MKAYRPMFLILVLFITALGCGTRTEMEEEKLEILKLLAANDQALLNKDIEMMLSIYHEDVPMVVEGKVSRFTRNEGEQMWRKLFDNVDYVEAGNLEDPIIHISPDGEMAWAIRQFRLKLLYKDSTGTRMSADDIGAELTVYEKKNSRWVLVASAESHQQGT